MLTKLQRPSLERKKMGDKTDDNKSIPKTMSTQHPDNANIPTWSIKEAINGN
jgi:hypothetical protein